MRECTTQCAAQIFAARNYVQNLKVNYAIVIIHPKGLGCTHTPWIQTGLKPVRETFKWMGI